MKLRLQCDKCGRIGTPEEIFTGPDGEDFCHHCNKLGELASLKQRYADKKLWLEATHLKELRELEKQIADLEGK